MDSAESSPTRLTRNASLLFAARVTSALTTLAVLSLVSRLRGPDDLGLVALGFAAGGILAVLSDLGLGLLLVREASRDQARTNTLLGTILAARLVTIPLLLGGTWLILVAVFGASASIVWLSASGLVVQQLAELTRSLSLARGRFGVMAAHSIIENVLWLAVIAVVLAAGLPLGLALLGGLLAFAGSVLAGLGIARFVLGARPRMPTRPEAARLAGDARPFSVFTVLNVLYSRLDTLLVGLLVPSSALVAAGAYYAATRMVAAFEYLPEALSRSLFPDLSRGFAVDPSRLESLLRRPAQFLLFIGIPVPFGVVVFGPWLMGILFGPRISSFSWILVGLAALVPLRFLSSLFGVTLTSADAQGRRVVGAALALVAVALTDVVLIPRLGVAGALLGAAAATVILLVIYTANVRPVLGTGLPLAHDAAVALLASAGALGAGMVVRSVASDPLATVAFGVAYVALLIAISRPRLSSWPLRGRRGPA
ncbi:MAG TPA: oligosaccharide flippase family protein [Candidatus Limnocylindrales bacterium]